MMFLNDRLLDFITLMTIFSRMPHSFIRVPLEFKLPILIAPGSDQRFAIEVEYVYGGILLDKWRENEPPEKIRITVLP
jgi:hypothetical protein